MLSPNMTGDSALKMADFGDEFLMVSVSQQTKHEKPFNETLTVDEKASLLGKSGKKGPGLLIQLVHGVQGLWIPHRFDMSITELQACNPYAECSVPNDSTMSL